MKGIKRSFLPVVAGALALLGGLHQGAVAATISSASAIYALATNQLQVDLVFSSTTSAPTTTGIQTLVVDFDGAAAPFSGATTLSFSSPGASISAVDATGDGILLNLAVAVATSPASFSFIFDNIDAASIDAAANKSVDIFLNYLDPNGQAGNVAPGFSAQSAIDPPSLDNVTNAVAGTIAAVPAPGTLALIGLGLAGMGLRGRRKRSS